MISRRTARVIGQTYESEFVTSKSKYYSGSRAHGYETKIHKDKLYDFLFDNDYPTWLLNQAQDLSHFRRKVQEWIMRLHTGETQTAATKSWSWEQRRALGQQYLEELGEDMLNRLVPPRDQYSEQNRVGLLTELRRSLELDGYTFRDGILLRPESDVVDVREERGVLRDLFSSLALANGETTFHHLSLSEEHYLAGKWDDSISNSRKFFESVMQEVGAANSSCMQGRPLPERIYTRPADVRDYLEKEGLLETKEKEVIAKVYGLLSHTGGHPYMAQNDQARLLRHLSLTLSQFVMLRLQGKMSSSTATPA